MKDIFTKDMGSLLTEVAAYLVFALAALALIGAILALVGVGFLGGLIGGIGVTTVGFVAFVSLLIAAIISAAIGYGLLVIVKEFKTSQTFNEVLFYILLVIVAILTLNSIGSLLHGRILSGLIGIIVWGLATFGLVAMKWGE